MRRLVNSLLISASLLLPALRPAAPAGAMRADVLCMGYLQATPAKVHIGGWLTLRGRGFTCTDPAGKLFPSAAVIVYKPHYGFTIYTAKVAPNGKYLLRVRIPSTLIAASSISGGKQTNVATQPGTYFIAIRLFDVDLPPPSQSVAHFQVEK